MTRSSILILLLFVVALDLGPLSSLMLGEEDISVGVGELPVDKNLSDTSLLAKCDFNGIRIYDESLTMVMKMIVGTYSLHIGERSNVKSTTEERSSK